jgi:hypothetical protein
MSEYMFGLTNESITKKEGKRRDKIAQKFGATFVGPISRPDGTTKGWFAGPNRGHPFNDDLRRNVMEACGL